MISHVIIVEQGTNLLHTVRRTVHATFVVLHTGCCDSIVAVLSLLRHKLLSSFHGCCLSQENKIARLSFFREVFTATELNKVSLADGRVKGFIRSSVSETNCIPIIRYDSVRPCLSDDGDGVCL
jgi:hypothetical protein